MLAHPSKFREFLIQLHGLLTIVLWCQETRMIPWVSPPVFSFLSFMFHASCFIVKTFLSYISLPAIVSFSLQFWPSAPSSSESPVSHYHSPPPLCAIYFIYCLLTAAFASPFGFVCLTGLTLLHRTALLQGNCLFETQSGSGSPVFESRFIIHMLISSNFLNNSHTELWNMKNSVN